MDHVEANLVTLGCFCCSCKSTPPTCVQCNSLARRVLICGGDTYRCHLYTVIIPRGRMLAIITIDDEPQTRRIRQSFKLSTAILLCQPSGSATVGYRYLEATSTERTCDLCFCSANLEAT